MRHYHDCYRFAENSLGEDGVEYNFYFEAYDDACAAWRYPDLTEHTEYLASVIDQTINLEMRKEAGYLRSIRSARARIKEVIEGPDTVIDQIIRSIRDNHGALSNKLRKRFPLLDDPDLGSAVTRIVQEEFGNLGLNSSNDDEIGLGR